jgi:hypothetical protein
MRLIPLIKMKYAEYERAVKSYLAEKLSSYGEKYGSSTVFGQLLSVLGSTTENTMSYIEDAMTEQNKYTAQRKRSVYSLAVISGYIPSMGHAAVANLTVNFKPSNQSRLGIVISNRTKVICTQNGMVFNIVLPQESIIMDLDSDKYVKQLYAVEGKFETQKFVSKGGQLYSQLVRTKGDVDTDYISVKINGDTWEKIDSIYDMAPDGKQYIVRPTQVKGFTVTFGNDECGRSLKEGDLIEVTYLMHSGEAGNIDPMKECHWAFKDPLLDISGEEVDGNQVLVVNCDNTHGVTAGTYSETTELVRSAIGTSSRSLVLADPKNYKTLIDRFSFCGYSRTWSEEGSLIINSIIMRNYREMLKEGKDYFSLSESDFTLTEAQKQSVVNTIDNSGQQLAGAVYNIFDPELCKYACYIYVKMKRVNYNQTFITNKIRDLVGEFFSDIENDMFIPKSDLIHLIKNSISEIDSVDVYFLSERNERAIRDGYYTETDYKYDPATGHYKIKETKYAVEPGEDPGVGLDEHGNIWLTSQHQFPVLMGGWSYDNPSAASREVSQEPQTIQVNDPLTVVIQ